jgi:hypothetical protein
MIIYELPPALAGGKVEQQTKGFSQITKNKIIP